jgi:protein TonB
MSFGAAVEASYGDGVRRVEPGARVLVLLLVVVLHGLALWALASYAPARAALETTVTLRVSLVQPQATPSPPKEAPKPLPVQPKPKPKPKPKQAPPLVKAPEPLPQLAVPEEVPAPEAPPVEVPLAHVPGPAPVEAPPAAPVAAPPPLVPPRFDADYLSNPPPEYPALSRRLGEEGQVLLRVRVSAEGLPLAVELRRSSGFQRLDEAARAAVKGWKFVPARRGETPVEAWVLIPISFTLRG